MAIKIPQIMLPAEYLRMSNSAHIIKTSFNPDSLSQDMVNSLRFRDKTNESVSLTVILLRALVKPVKR